MKAPDNDRTMHRTHLKLIASGGGFDALCAIKYYPAASSPDRRSHITRVTFSVNGEIQSVLNLGPAISENPLFGVHIPSLSPDDRVKVEWVDTRAHRGIGMAKVTQ